MAILQSTGIRGFLVSVKKTGNKIINSLGKTIDDYAENFLSGFAGYGWKLWEYVSGKWKLEIDALTVRGTFSVYELLIQKVRAIKGALGITQANGKIKTVDLSSDGTEYLVTIEDEMSFVTNDFIRCQNWTGNVIKLYHVKVQSVTENNTIIHLLVSDFDKNETGTVTNPPEAGDEIVQFGNQTDNTRQSAIYLHADEGGQPAIDVMFGINSTDWANKVKIRIGGEIPGSGGLKGFYCVNGMIKGVNESGHTTYSIYPDGSAMFGDGSAEFRADKSGYLAGGAISWHWDEQANKFRTTMGDVLLEWNNLSEETKENLKGEKGDKGDTGDSGEQGNDGEDGESGSVVVRFEWVSGVRCIADGTIPDQTADTNKYLSVAMVRDNSLASGWRAYKCLQTHTSAAENAPGNLTYWSEFPLNIAAVFTSLIIAKNAKIDFLSGNAIRILDSDGKVTACFTGEGSDSNAYRLFVGGETAEESPFRVDKSGYMTSSRGKIGGVRIDGDNLTNEGFNNDASVILRNDTHQTFAAIGGNVLPASTGLRAVARFENNEPSDQLNMRKNIGLFVQAANAYDNIAIYMAGGHISGLALKVVHLTATDTATSEDCYFSCYNQTTVTLRLSVPTTRGKIYYVRINNSSSVIIDAHTIGGKQLMGKGGEIINTATANTRGELITLLWDGQYWLYSTTA